MIRNASKRPSIRNETSFFGFFVAPEGYRNQALQLFFTKMIEIRS